MVILLIFHKANVTDSFSFKEKILDQTGDNGTKDVEIMVPLKYLSNFLGTLEITFTNCEIHLILSWSANSVLLSTAVANQGAPFTITDAKLYALVVTLSTQDNATLFQQLKILVSKEHLTGIIMLQIHIYHNKTNI